MLYIDGIDDLRSRVGTRLGTSSWHDVPQPVITRFADATEDFERLHLDSLKGREAGYGGTIAHGLYTLSMGPALVYEIYTITGVVHWLNYGFDRVRFINPVKVDSRIRLHLDLTAVQDIAHGVRATFVQTFEIEGEEKPACVAEGILAYFDTYPTTATTSDGSA